LPKKIFHQEEKGLKPSGTKKKKDHGNGKEAFLIGHPRGNNGTGKKELSHEKRGKRLWIMGS